MNDKTLATPLVTAEEYLKLASSVEKLYGIIWDNQIITRNILEDAMEIYNEAEIRTFSEIKKVGSDE